MRAPDLAGRALDERYELHAVIGEGAFGRVYRGLDRRLARTVAVKVIKPWWAEDSEWVERFEREAQLLARISDPGIVQIFDIGHAEEGPYYVAELVEGESLAERLRRGPLPAAEARRIAEQLCDALASAHAQGVVHCDVKPANVLLASDGKVKVGDFGVARLAEGTSQALTATVAGTPRYMSPEQARGRATTPATDVYSAGIVLYEMLAGRPPFMEGSPVELGLRHVQDEPPPLPAGVPSDLREVVSRALAKEPAERFADGAAMAAALRDADANGASSPVAARGRRPTRASGGASTRRGCPCPTPPTRPSEGRIRRRRQTAATIDLAGAETLDASAARTRLLPRGGQAPPPGPAGPPRRPRPRRKPAPADRRARGRARAGRGVLAVVVLSGAGARTTVPELRGLPRGRRRGAGAAPARQAGVLDEPLGWDGRRDRDRAAPVGGDPHRGRLDGAGRAERGAAAGEGAGRGRRAVLLGGDRARGRGPALRGDAGRGAWVEAGSRHAPVAGAGGERAARIDGRAERRRGAAVASADELLGRR